MKTTIIHLEAYDDVNSARDKLRFCDSGRVLLVWPKNGQGLNRRLELSLLQRQSQQQGIQLSFICQNDEIFTLAHELGVPVFESVEDANKLSWRRVRRSRSYFEAKSIEKNLSAMQAWLNRRRCTFWENKYLRLAVLGLAAIAVLSLIFLCLTGARIEMPLIQAEQSLDMTVWVNPQITTILPSGVIPGRRTTVVVEGQAEMDSSGTVMVPENTAAGFVSFTNLTAYPVKIPVGTVVMTLSIPTVRFATVWDDEIPAGSGRTLNISVRAIKAGVEGNVSAGEIRTIEGNLGLGLLVTNPAAIAGGSARENRSPTNGDYAALHQKLLGQLKPATNDPFSSVLTNGEIVIPETISLQRIVQEKQEPPSGISSEKARLSLRVEYMALVYRKTDLESVARIALNANLEKGMLAEPTLTIQPIGEVSRVEGSVKWNLRVNRSVHRVFSKEQVIQQAAGRRVDEAGNVLAAAFGLAQQPIIKVYPDWWPWLPGLPFRIEVVSP